MPISPTSNTIVSFPSGALNPPGIPVISQVSETQKDIFSTFANVGQSALLQNPVTDAINGFDTNITSILDTINNSTCLSGGDKTSLTTAFGGAGGLKEQLDLFKTHTDTLSGVIQATTGSTTPGLDQILSVGQSMNTIANTVAGAAGCIDMLSNMSGLFSQDQLNGFAGEIAGFLAQINNCLADVNAILSRVTQIKNAIAGIMAADKNFFTDALNKLKQAALAGLLESLYKDPCGKFVLENVIGRTDLVSKLQGRR